MNRETIEKKLEALRAEYIKAPLELRPIIEMKARPWKSALVMIDNGIKLAKDLAKVEEHSIIEDTQLPAFNNK